METVITFEPKHGWLLNEERKFRLYLSGINLQNSSIVFSSSIDECTSSDFISPIYSLSSASIIEINVELQSISKSHSSIYMCLLSSSNHSLTLMNDTNTQNATQLVGAYFTFLREKGRLPFAAKICLILMLFIVSGFFSGLNLGLMSMSVNDLRLIAESEDASLRYYARRVLPLRRRGNYLLCSIVLANVLVNSLGTVLLDSLVHGLFAVIGSTIMIVLMGEIIPQAICSRYGLIIGAHTHVITWISMIITGIISYPLGFILDKILGQEVTASYTRDQIAGMLTRISADIEKPELDVITGLTEKKIFLSGWEIICCVFKGVLSLRKKTVKEAMTWLPDVFMLEKDRQTDAELLLDVHKHGFSRIPVYSRDKFVENFLKIIFKQYFHRSNVIGIVKLRDFALITPEQYHLTVKHMMEFHTRMYSKIFEFIF
jgi:metal transporter CNNM